MQDGQKTALVLGATGGIGGAMATRLIAGGWRVVAMIRQPERKAADRSGIRWVGGDALRPADVLAAATGADLILHAVNPPGYRDWDRLVLPMLDATLAAARATGARILLPGTVYNYGPDAFPLIGEDSAQQPQTAKGRIRVAMEQRLEAAAGEGVPVLIVRAGDYFGPGAGNTWFSQMMVQPGKPVRLIVNPARAGAGHQWNYLPDVAETMARLLERGDSLPRFARFHMAGFFDSDGNSLADAVDRVTGRRALRLRFPWGLMPLAGRFSPFLRELAEMDYLWKTTIRLDNRLLVETLGAEPRTPIDDALRITLDSLGCSVPPPAPAGALVVR